MNQANAAAITDPNVEPPAFLPANGQRVRVVEIAPWDEWPEHREGQEVIASVNELDGLDDNEIQLGSCRCDSECNTRHDTGSWLLLCEWPSGFKRTLCRVVPV